MNFFFTFFGQCTNYLSALAAVPCGFAKVSDTKAIVEYL